MANDPASINPKFVQKNEKYLLYYRELNSSLKHFKYLIAKELNIDSEDIFINTNASSALITVLGAFNASGINVISVNKYKNFSPYNDLFQENFLSVSRTEKVYFITHLSPITIDIDESHLHYKNEEYIVDATQSVGTVLTDRIFSNNSISIFSLHKHFAISNGLSIIILNKYFRSKYPKLLKYVTLFENGCISLDTIHQAIREIKSQKIWNKAVIQNKDIENNHLEISKNFQIYACNFPLPMISIKLNKSVDPKLIKNIENAKYFKKENIIRFSYSHLRSKNGKFVNMTHNFLKDLKGIKYDF